MTVKQYNMNLYIWKFIQLSISWVFNNKEFMIWAWETKGHERVDDNSNHDIPSCPQEACWSMWGRDWEPDGACAWQSMAPAAMESNYSVPVPWEADDKASMFPAFIYTRCNN